MTKTLAAKVAEGIRSQRWTLSGYGGTWDEAMRPLEEYVKRKVEKAVAAEREACAKVCDVLSTHPEYASEVTKLAAQAIRARSNT